MLYVSGQSPSHPTTVVASVTARLPLAVKGGLPTRGAMKQVVRRVRRKLQLAPPNPTSVYDLIIPEEYQRYESVNGVFEQFLLADSGDEGRILIFGRYITFLSLWL